MFDGIIKNTISDVLKSLLVAAAGYLGIGGTTEQQFVAGGMALFAGLWMWYENKGHQQIVDLLKKTTDTKSLPVAKSIAQNRVVSGIVLALFALLIYASDARAQMVVKAPPLPVAPLAQSCLTSCSVWFAGGGIGGSGSNLDIIGGGLDNSVFANGGMAFVNAGAMYATAQYFLSAEFGGGYLFGPASSIAGASASESGAIGFAFAEAGGNLAGLFGTAPSISVNNALITDLISLYAGVGPVIQSTGTYWGTVGGARYALGSILLDVKYIYANQQASEASSVNKSIQLVLAGVDIPFKF